MSTEPAPEQPGLPKCGRLVFRGVELAYLNIDGEYMLPLAELLALVLPTTPRTTLFTRMEKMKVRRHFCQPEEIKLLKTVNGIHGSSANCTLLSKTEVDKYCSMYIDNLSESNKGKCKEDITNESQIASEEHSMENCKSNDMESVCLNNNEIPSKLTILHKHKKSPPLKAKLKLTKIANGMKLKSALSADRHLNQTLTDKESSTAIDGHVTSGCINEEGVPPVSPELLCSVHASNFTQTQPLHANNKRLKKRDRNLNSETNKKRKLSRVKKRPSTEFESKHEFESPLKIPKRNELNGHKEESDKVNETSQFHFARCSQSSKKQEVDFLISDSSSIDSGFASTVLSNASTPTKTDFPAGELSGLLRKDEEAIQKHEHSSPRRAVRPPKLKTPTKNKFKESEGTSLTLSPPALLLKRYEDSWQVEQKSPVKEVANCLHKRKVKTKEKALPGGLAPLVEEACGQAVPHFENKQAKKRRKRRKPPILKEETSITNDLIDREKPGNAGVKKRRLIKRKQTGKFTREKPTLPNGKVVSPEKSNDFLPTKVKKSACVPQENPSLNTRIDRDKQSKEDLLKKDAVLDRIVGDAMAKFFGPKSSPVCTLASPSSSTPPKPSKPKKAKVATTTKPVLKTNSKFKLLNLFPVTSQLGLQDCGLCPVFTMSCPIGFQPPSSHPLWGWRLGEAVYKESLDKSLKPKPVSKPKQTQSNSSTKFVANKVRKLKRRRRRKKVPTSKTPLSASVPTPVVNATISDSNATENVSNSDSEVKLSLCDVISSIVSSSEILMS